MTWTNKCVPVKSAFTGTHLLIHNVCVYCTSGASFCSMGVGSCIVCDWCIKIQTTVNRLKVVYDRSVCGEGWRYFYLYISPALDGNIRPWFTSRHQTHILSACSNTDNLTSIATRKWIKKPVYLKSRHYILRDSRHQHRWWTITTTCLMEPQITSFGWPYLRRVGNDVEPII
jgi:hypothetical protein